MRLFHLNARKITLLLIVISIVFSAALVNAEVDYRMEFRGADVKSTIRLLAKMGGKNIVVPDKVDGKVTASFRGIDFKEAIESILKANNFGVIEENGILLVIPKEELETLGEDLIVESHVLNHAKAEDIVTQVQSLVTSRGTAVADERTNTIHIKDTKSSVKSVKSFIASLDKKSLQVLIEARIIEASLAFVRGLGIQWGITKSGGNVQTAGLSSVGTADSGRSLLFNGPATGYRGSAPLGGIGLILGSFRGTMTDVQITAAEQNGTINVLARPSIVTMDNQVATIRSGMKFYVKTNADISIGGGGTSGSAALGNNLQEIDTGIELKVTPQVSSNNFIKLQIEATQSEPDFSQEVEGIPTVIDNKATTSVLLKDGETTIIGGLFKIRDARTVKGVPGLMKIPILGNLFKTRKKEKEKKELLIFISPHIVKEHVRRLDHFTEKESTYHGVVDIEKHEADMEAAVDKAQKDAADSEKKSKKKRRHKWNH